DQPAPEGMVPARWRKAGRYIVEADGVLRAALGSGSGPTTFPAQTRTLTHRQVRDLWRMIGDAGLLDPASPARIPEPERTVPRAEAPVAVLEITAGGKATGARVGLAANSPDSAAARDLIDRLAEWAWQRSP